MKTKWNTGLKWVKQSKRFLQMCLNKEKVSHHSALMNILSRLEISIKLGHRWRQIYHFESSTQDKNTCPQPYPGLQQTSKMEQFAAIVNGSQPSTIVNMYLLLMIAAVLDHLFGSNQGQIFNYLNQQPHTPMDTKRAS